MKIITTLLTILLYSSSFSQEWSNIQKNEQLSIDISKIIYESPSDGIKHERLVFQYTNLTNSEITISFQRSVSYGASRTLKLQEKTYEVHLPANSSVSYSDKTKHDKTFYVFAKDLKGTIKRSLTNFEVTNIQTQ